MKIRNVGTYNLYHIKVSFNATQNSYGSKYNIMQKRHFNMKPSACVPLNICIQAGNKYKNIKI